MRLIPIKEDTWLQQKDRDIISISTAMVGIRTNRYLGNGMMLLKNIQPIQ